MKSLIKLSFILLTATALAALPARAADDATSTTTNAPVKPRKRAAQYTGTIQSVDTGGMSLTLTNRTGQVTVKVTSTTRIRKDRQPATFADAEVGLRVRGSGVKDEDGVWTAHTLNIMSAPKAPADTAPASPTTPVTPAAPTTPPQ